MHILLTNDDGVHAPGIAALAAAFSPSTQLTIVAPDRGYSGCGHQVTNHSPIHVAQLKWETPGDENRQRFEVFGTPADCARLGATEIGPDADWLISGINDGGNLGVDVFMSGTVAAAREAVWLGKPAIAISQYIGKDGTRDWAKATAMARRAIEFIWDRSHAENHLATAFWNVNLPDVDHAATEPQIIDAFLEPGALSVRYTHDSSGYQMQGDYRGRPRTPGSDVDVCFGGNIAVTRIPAMA